MKAINYLLSSILLALISYSVTAQNGVTPYAMPTGYTNTFLNNKTSMAIDASNNVFIGFRQIGLGKFTPSTSTWVMFDTANSGIPSNNVMALTALSNGDMWVGTNKGLALFNGSNWTIYNKQNSAIQSDTVQCLFATPAGLWAGTPKGLCFFNGSFTSYTTSNSGIVNDTVTCLDVDSSGVLLTGTQHGLSLFNGSNWTNYTTANSGLISNAIRQVKYVSSKATWISTPSGICKLFNGTITGYSCNSTNTFGYYYPTPAIAKKNNQLYVFANPLPRINDNDTVQIAQVNVKPNASSVPANAYFAFDSNGHLWTAYRGIGTSYGLSEFDESLSSGFSTYNSVISNQKNIDINKVNALINVQGDMFWDLIGSARYEVPKCTGKNAVFAGALWIGGYDANGNLHTAAQTYRQTGSNDFLPGPLDTTNMATDSLLTITPYDNIWKIDRATIDAFKINFLNGNVGSGIYPVPGEILTYPAIGAGNITRNLAPYIDYNNDGNYNPYDGDYPLIKGDQQLYWIFNDSTTHTETNGPAFGFEIHAQAYAYSCDQYQLGDSNAVLDYTTFYKYEIINRSQNTYDSVFIGLFADVDLGDYNDDYLGCDTVLNAGFTYNGDNDDGGGTAAGYGLNPPMINCQVLKGPEPVLNDGIDNDHDGTIDEAGELNMLTVFRYYWGDFTIYGNPETADDYYEFLTARYKDGSHMTYGGTGFGGSTYTNYFFSSTPYSSSGWNEVLNGNPPGDRRFVASSGPFRIAPGESRTIDFAYLFTWDSTQANGLNTSIARNTADLQRVKYWFDNNNFPSCLNTGIQNISESIPHVNIYPNPANTYLTIDCKAPSTSNINIMIYDMMGRIITNKKINTFDRISVAGLSPSVYFIKINVDGKVVTKKFVR